MEPTRSSKALIIYKKYFRLIPAFYFCLLGLYGQEKITFKFDKTEVSTALNYLIDKHNLTIVYPSNIGEYIDSSTCENCDREEALSSILKGTSLTFEKFENQFVVYFEKAKTIFSGPKENTLIQYFKDDATAFNAKKFKVLEGKGEINNLISGHLMEILSNNQIPNHFIKKISILCLTWKYF